MAKDMEIPKLQVTGLEISSPEPSGSLRTAQLPAALDLEAGVVVGEEVLYGA